MNLYLHKSIIDFYLFSIEKLFMSLAPTLVSTQLFTNSYTHLMQLNNAP